MEFNLTTERKTNLLSRIQKVLPGTSGVQIMAYSIGNTRMGGITQ